MLPMQIRDLRNGGCEAVTLSCSEISLLVRAADSDLPILDSTRILPRDPLRVAARPRELGAQALSRRAQDEAGQAGSIATVHALRSRPLIFVHFYSPSRSPRLPLARKVCEKAMRARSHGLRRARFWRALGFPNLALAREARARNCARRRELVIAGYTRKEASVIVKARCNVARAVAAKTPEGRNLQAYLNSSRDL